MGRDLWETAELTASERNVAKESFFDDGRFPDTTEALKAAADAIKLDAERPHPFSGKTIPWLHLSIRDYKARIESWLRNVMLEREPPTEEQMRILRKVADRVLQEFEDEKFGADVPEETRRSARGDCEEPLRGLIHGHPGTGKSKVIMWIRNFFEKALGWEHGVHFLCSSP